MAEIRTQRDAEVHVAKALYEVQHATLRAKYPDYPARSWDELIDPVREIWCIIAGSVLGAVSHLDALQVK